MPEFLIILLVVGAFLGVFYLTSVVQNRKLLRHDSEQEQKHRKAA
jgi:hypothetical protein